MVIIKIPTASVAVRPPIDAQRFIEALALPSLLVGTRSPIMAVSAGVAIEPKSAWTASSMISWVALVTNIIGIHSAETVRPLRIMKDILFLSLSLSLPQITCITLFEMFDEDWNQPISEGEAPSFTA